MGRVVFFPRPFFPYSSRRVFAPAGSPADALSVGASDRCVDERERSRREERRFSAPRRPFSSSAGARSVARSPSVCAFSNPRLRAVSLSVRRCARASSSGDDASRRTPIIPTLHLSLSLSTLYSPVSLSSFSSRSRSPSLPRGGNRRRARFPNAPLARGAQFRPATRRRRPRFPLAPPRSCELRNVRQCDAVA